MNCISSDTLHVALVLSVSLSVILFTLWAYEDMSGSPLYSSDSGGSTCMAQVQIGVYYMGVHIGARSTWQIRLNCPYLAVMWPLSNFFDHLFGSSQCMFVSDIAIFVLKRDVKLQLTNSQCMWFHCCRNCGRCGSSY